MVSMSLFHQQPADEFKRTETIRGEANTDGVETGAYRIDTSWGHSGGR